MEDLHGTVLVAYFFVRGRVLEESLSNEQEFNDTLDI